jgi:hypothetical protein
VRSATWFELDNTQLPFFIRYSVVAVTRGGQAASECPLAGRGEFVLTLMVVAPPSGSLGLLAVGQRLLDIF